MYKSLFNARTENEAVGMYFKLLTIDRGDGLITVKRVHFPFGRVEIESRPGCSSIGFSGFFFMW